MLLKMSSSVHIVKSIVNINLKLIYKAAKMAKLGFTWHTIVILFKFPHKIQMQENTQFLKIIKFQLKNLLKITNFQKL